ncbi:MAG: dTDP-4-dehydrorhamnose 3,5-epimerase [Verrucomicrobiae bacterium]|nr:dTDP-4-dehydrorhamnose 3,5-epimerase [Verrucomicrobiae bacterium]MCX7721561.1 dTDP-4-dehydrorhamnose 3,5-epimerase [Verrucomicrobiae bacterium]MDW7980553.1 dTDP-4-dehydrorhamnose 3,5-epimerase [Verrucomicrobiales bacterium]
MQVIKCELDGLLLIVPDAYADARGYFLETWHQRRYAAHGIDWQFVQDNLSFSRRGVLRGLHFQNPTPQGKLVSILHGEVFDVAVDIRRSSPTFKRWQGFILSAENKHQLFIPPGFAHGFVVLSETALCSYKCTDFYSQKNELTIRWNDPELGINWPVTNPILSTKDATAPLLCELPPDRLFP